MKYLPITLGLILSVSFLSVAAQTLDSENKLSILLKDGTTVNLYGKATSEADVLSNEYYYLPLDPKVSTNINGDPSFLFQRFTMEDKNDPYNGGLIHFLMEWGLSKEQRKELDNILKKGLQRAKKGSVLLGATNVEPGGDDSFQIISGTFSGENTPKLVTSGQAPLMPGNKIAAAGLLDAKNTQLLGTTLTEETAISDLSIGLSYKYNVLTPAVKGNITVDWSKVFKEIKKEEATYAATHKKTRRGGLFGFVVDSYFGRKSSVQTQSYDEVRSAIDSLIERKVIQINIDAFVADERADKVVNAFLEFFFEQITNTIPTTNPNKPGKKEKEAIPNIKIGKKYTYKREYFEHSLNQQIQVYQLNYRLTITRYHTTLGNVGNWIYSHQANERCIPPVMVLNDPDFEHREVQVILDGEVEKLSSAGELNFVNVKIRKQRHIPDARDFEKEQLFNREEMAKVGNLKTFSYSKAKSDNPDVFEYKVKWSYSGGKEIIQDTGWIKGDWQGITLKPSITSENIILSANKKELNALGIVNVTLQLKYSKFGKIKNTSIDFNLLGDGKPIQQSIYRDKATKGYLFRLIYTQKNQGYIVTDWTRNISNNIYAFTPKGLKGADTSKLEEILKDGEKILDAAGKASDDIEDIYKDWILKD